MANGSLRDNRLFPQAVCVAFTDCGACFFARRVHIATVGVKMKKVSAASLENNEIDTHTAFSLDDQTELELARMQR